MPVKPYSKNEKPFVYAVFSRHDAGEAVPVMEKIHADGVSFWFPEAFTKREIRRMEAAYSCIIFVSQYAIRDETVRRSAEYAVLYNKKILYIYLEPTPLSPGLEFLLNALQSIDKSRFPDEQSFVEKLKSADVFSEMEITPAQKRFARRRAVDSVFVPIAAAAAVFFAVVIPLLVVPMARAANGSLSRVGFGKLSLSDLARVEELNVVGNQSLDRWYVPLYTDATEKEVYVNDLGVYMPVGDISDITDLALLKNATVITFQANQVTDISPLCTIKTLRYLALNCNPIKSIEGIEALQNLRGITLNGTDVSDISPLFKIPTLENICFESTYVNSIEGIGNLARLTELRTGDSNLTDISPLNQIDFSYINDTDGFAFNAHQSRIKDFSPLKRIPKFREVSVNVRRMDSILPYIRDKEVHHVKIGGSDIRSIEQLSSIKFLDILHLAGSYQLTSLDGIEKHTGLQEILLIHCPNIADFTPLLELPELTCLIVSPDMEAVVAPQLAGAGFEIRYEEEGV